MKRNNGILHTIGLAVVAATTSLWLLGVSSILAQESSENKAADTQKPVLEDEKDKGAAPEKGIEPEKRGGDALAHHQGREAVVRIGGDAEVREGETAQVVVVIGGDAKVAGNVREDLVTVMGNVELNGEVKGDMVVVLGSAKLGPKAVVKGDAVVVFGKLDRAPGAVIRGEPFNFDFGGVVDRVMPVVKWVKHGLFMGRPLPPTSGLAWFFVGLHFLIYLIIAVLLPKPVQSCAQVIETKGVQAFLVGLLALMLSGPVMLILAASGAGLLVLPFLWLAVVGAVFVGRTATLQFIGLQTFRIVSAEASPRPFLAFLVGSVLVCFLYMVPFLGFVVWGVLLALGLGATILAMFAAMRKNGKTGAGGGPVAVTVAPPGGPLAPIAVGVAPIDGTCPPVVAPGPGGASVPESIAMPRVGFWLRFAAALLDLLLLGCLIPITGPFFILLLAVYHVAMWAWKGTTVGGIVCGIKVVRLDGRPVDFGVALVRCLAAVFSALPLCLGFFWAGWSAERQSWHDKIAGTVIVKVPKGMSLV